MIGKKKPVPQFFVSYSWASLDTPGKFGFGWRVRIGAIKTGFDIASLCEILETDVSEQMDEAVKISIISWQKMDA